jgi:polysaccharide biosynthesis transport protein
MSESLPLPATTLADRWEALRRRRRPAIWTGLAVLATALAAALFWPPTYRSTGTVLIEQQELPQDLVMSTITSFADQRIQVISQRVMTTENLLRIIQRYDLYPALRKNEPREVLLERMRKDIRFVMISADVMDPRQGRATKANIAFAVSYDSGNPELAARVANELISLYLDENLKSRRQQTADAAAFLEDEATRLSKHIDELQANLAAFKNKHINTLPDQGLYNNQLVTQTENELRDTDTQLRSLDQEATYLDAQLAQISPSSQVYTSTGERVLSPADRLKFLRTEYARLTGLYAPEHPDVVRTKREIEGLELSVGKVDVGNDLQRQLQDARTRLAAAQKQYAPDHPDVKSLQRQVDTLAQAIKDNAPATPGAGSVNPDNPAYIQVKAQREATEAQRASLRQKRTELQARLGQLGARLAAIPAVERDYVELARELDNDQLKYREVRQKQMSAKLAETLEDQQKGERFTLIDPPLVPEKPASPNRLLLGGLGFALAVVAAIAAVALLEQLDPSVRNRRDLELLLQVPPLAILPVFTTSAERAARRRRRRYLWASALGACCAALVLTHVLYRPLDVLWAVARRKLGV